MVSFTGHKNIRDIAAGFLSGVGYFYYEFLNGKRIITEEGLAKDDWLALVRQTTLSNKEIMTVTDTVAMMK